MASIIARIRHHGGQRLHLAGLPGWIHGLALAGIVLSTLTAGIVFVLWKDVNVWASFRPSSELHDPAYNETTHVASVFRTRANTWSNLAYVYAGLYVIAIGLGDSFRPRTRGEGILPSTPPLTIYFGLACCLLGVGSGIFHASMTRWGQHLDVVSMYLPLLALIAACVSRWAPRLGQGGFPSWPITVGASLVVWAYLVVNKWEMSSTNVLGTLIVAVGALSVIDWAFFKRRYAIGWLLAALTLFLLAFWFRALDVAGRFSGPDAWWQGHSVWHVLTALSLVSAYLFYRSEIPPAAE